MTYPYGVAVDRVHQSVFIADSSNHKIRVVNSIGIITTFAGTGQPGYSGDNGMATSAQLNYPQAVAVSRSGGSVYIVDYFNHMIRVVDSAGIITTFAGTGQPGYSGDGDAATSAQLNYPASVAADLSGSLYIADSGNNMIRMVDTSGIITIFAGTAGQPGNSGDGGMAILAQLSIPQGVAVGDDGKVYIADTYNNEVRLVTMSGIITTFAGTGTQGSSGDGGAATSAQLYYPQDVVVDVSGNVYIADTNNNEVRLVMNGTGIITTFAGGPYKWLPDLGDGDAATDAQLNQPVGLDLDASGANLYIADSSAFRVRKVTSFFNYLLSQPPTQPPTSKLPHQSSQQPSQPPSHTYALLFSPLSLSHSLSPLLLLICFLFPVPRSRHYLCIRIFQRDLLRDPSGIQNTR